MRSVSNIPAFFRIVRCCDTFCSVLPAMDAISFTDNCPLLRMDKINNRLEFPKVLKNAAC